MSASYEEAVEEVSPIESTKSNAAKKAVRWFLLVLITFLPVFFLSSAVPVWYGKQLFATVLAGAAFIAWLIDFLISGRFQYRKSFLNISVFLLLAVLFFSTLFSVSFYESIWGLDQTGEKLPSFIVFAIVFFLTGSVFRERDGIKLGLAVFSSVLIVGLLNLFQMLGVRLFSGAWAGGADFNPVGTINALAVFYGLITSVGIGVLSHFKEIPDGGMKKYFSWLVWATVALMLLNLFLITNFKIIWLGLAVSMIVLLSLGMRVFGKSGGSPDRGAGIRALGGISFYLPLIVLVLSLLLFVSSFQQSFMDALTGGAQSQNRWSLRFPAEVSPNFRATLNIGKQSLEENMWLGSGPGTFIYDYSLYRDPILNLDRIFWAVKFFHGSALGTTLLATGGVLGVAVFILFVLSAFVVVLKNTLLSRKGDPLRFGIAAATVFGGVMWFLYPPTFTTSLFVFLMLGIFAALSNSESEDGLTLGMRTVSVSSTSVMFIASLLSIFFVVGSIVGMYYSFQKYRADSSYSRAVAYLNKSSDTDKPLAELANAIAIDPKESKYFRLQGQVYFLRLRNLIQSQLAQFANPSPELVQDFQTNFIEAYRAAQEAQRLNPAESSNWTLVGAICETVIQVDPLLCSEEFLTVMYEEAIPRDPIGPQAYLDAGRAYLIAADVLALKLSQTNNKDEITGLTEKRSEAIGKAIVHLEKSAALKPDFASSHFLLAQAYVRQNDLEGAIRKLEDTKAVAIGDVGVLFQLGFLYYQANRLDDAELQFAQAVRLNENYSNARYFLGLIYDQKGNTEAALEQFRKIADLNPGNKEVAGIVQNLESDRPALSQIVPPLPAPEERQAPPISDQGR